MVQILIGMKVEYTFGYIQDKNGSLKNNKNSIINRYLGVLYALFKNRRFAKMIAIYTVVWKTAIFKEGI